METRLFKNNWLTATGLLLALPAAFFILISVLKHSFGWSMPFDAVQPTLESWGIKKFGWNVNLLIVFGPVLAILLTIFQVIKFKWTIDRNNLLSS
jgi:hypothetical protein